MKHADPIRVLLVDDHQLVRAGVRAWISIPGKIKVVGEASSGEEAFKRSMECRPNVILMDVSLPDASGSQVTRKILHHLPKTKIIALTVHETLEWVQSMIDAGASGYVVKDVSPSELVEAIETVSAGNKYFCAGVSRNVVLHYFDWNKNARKAALTERERQVLAMIAEGLTNRQIAAKLSLSIRTVETHREHIMEKTGIHTIAGLTQFAIAQGILDTVSHDSRF